MIINTNMSSLSIYREYNKNLTNESAAVQQISSGIKIGSAKDDPNAMAQSERFRMQIRGLQVAGQNTQYGVSMLQTADGGIGGITSDLQKVRELLVQAGGATSDSDKQVIQTQINQMLDGTDDMAKNTDFNGVKLLAGGGNIEMLTGANVGEKVEIPKFDLTSQGLGLKVGTVDNIDVTNIDASLALVDTAISKVTGASSKYGAIENRLQSTYNNTMEISEKVQSADSGVRDSDMAEQMTEYSKDSVLVQAGNAMMAQSNKLSQDALQILDNIRSR